MNYKKILSSLFHSNKSTLDNTPLSFVASQKFANLTRKTNPYVLKESLGTHLAQGIIELEDGVVSTVNEEGHFSLHEFEKTDLQKQFNIISSLK